MPLSRADHQPSPSDLAVAPGGNAVGAIAHDQVKVVGKHGIAEHLEGEILGKQPQSPDDDSLAIGEIFSRDRIDSPQEASTDDAIVDVIDADFRRLKDLAACGSRHGLAPI